MAPTADSAPPREKGVRPPRRAAAQRHGEGAEVASLADARRQGPRRGPPRAGRGGVVERHPAPASASTTTARMATAATSGSGWRFRAAFHSAWRNADARISPATMPCMGETLPQPGRRLRPALPRRRGSGSNERSEGHLLCPHCPGPHEQDLLDSGRGRPPRLRRRAGGPPRLPARPSGGDDAALGATPLRRSGVLRRPRQSHRRAHQAGHRGSPATTCCATATPACSSRSPT